MGDIIIAIENSIIPSPFDESNVYVVIKGGIFIGILIAIVPVLIALIFSITLIVIVRMCLKDKVHNCSFIVNKDGFNANISHKG